MNHTGWLAAFEVAREKRKSGKRKECAQLLRRLAKASRRAAEGSVSEWHELQALEFRAMVLEEDGALAEAKAAYVEVAKMRRRLLKYHGTSLVNALSRAALLEYKLGNDRAAERLAEEAVALFGHHYDPAAMIVELLKEIQERGARRVRAELLPKSKAKTPKTTKKARTKKPG